MLILRALHIGAGVLWVGAAWTFYLFIGPSMRALAADAQQTFMTHLTRERRLTHVILGATIVTVAAGAILYWIQWQRFGELWFQSGYGISLTIGAIAALIAFAMGPTLIAPAFERMGELGARMAGGGGPPSEEDLAEMGHVGKRLQKLLTADSLLLVVAVFFMATAQYWG
ncbi:MAG TPA: hypothetical protein VM305_03735 [Candidatus Limnocylindrales bacterium]|nr:hypothetical protein [Candidatus Limnocylindrales bacterium]